MLRFVTSLAAMLVLASTAFGHEGHGHPEHQQGVRHYVVNPSHALPIALSAAVVSGIGILIRRSQSKGGS